MILFIDGNLKGKVVRNGPTKWEYIENGEEEFTYYYLNGMTTPKGVAYFYSLSITPSPEYVLKQIKEIQLELNAS